MNALIQGRITYEATDTVMRDGSIVYLAAPRRFGNYAHGLDIHQWAYLSRTDGKLHTITHAEYLAGEVS